jgi:methionine--tRNA ligase beta chain
VELKSYAPLKAPVEKQVLDQLDIRIGTIEAVTEVPGSEKLVELRVDFGDHHRNILVGMKQERADPREIKNKQALFVINLKPRKMAGRISEGMLLDIGYADELVPVLAVPERPVPDGARAG